MNQKDLVIEKFKTKLVNIIRENNIYEESDFNFITKISRSDEYHEMKKNLRYMYTIENFPHGDFNFNEFIIEDLFDEWYMNFDEILEEFFSELNEEEKIIFMDYLR